MVRVISAHHFSSQDVTTCPPPCCTAVAGDQLLLASSLHQVEVRDLLTSTPSHTFPTVDLLHQIHHSPVGNFLACLERRANGGFAVRVYINWWNPEVASQPMRARIAGRVTPASGEKEQLEMIEVGVKEPVTGIAVCSSTGNLVVSTGSTLIVYKYTLSSNQPNKTKYIDFEESLHIALNFEPTEVKIVEDTFACLDATQIEIFKIRIVDATDEKQLRSQSCYSFSSESECSLDIPTTAGPDKGSMAKQVTMTNITARRRVDSSSEREINEKIKGNKHPKHITIGGKDSDEEDSRDPAVELVCSGLVNRIERELGGVTTPRILEQLLGPVISENVATLVPTSFPGGRELAAEIVILVKANLVESELPHEKLGLIQLQPVYWREYRVRRDRGGGAISPPAAPHNPLQSAMYSHLMSVTAIFTSVHEGYLYHLPGHLRKPGRGLGVQRIATYPFTSPIIELVLEPCLLHALTETGLETYTLRSGYHSVREAETVDDHTNACPPTNTPICLIGLRPFLGVKQLLLAPTRLVLLAALQTQSSQPPSTDWTIYSLHLPKHLDLYRDMITVADMNAGAPHGHLQLLCEAHMVVRTWLHGLSWLMVLCPLGQIPSQQDLDQVKEAYQESCLRLADHYVHCQSERDHRLAIPYYRMSKLPPIEVFNRFDTTKEIPEGLIKYIEEIVLHSSSQENIIDAAVADQIISMLGKYSISTLVKLVINSPSLRNFKTRQTLEVLDKELQSCDGDVSADMAVAVVLVGGPGDWLCKASPVQLSTLLLSNHHLLVDPAAKGCQETFSDLAIIVRLHCPGIFVEVCVSLIESDLMSLGQMLHLLLQTFMSSVTTPTASAENASILQLFLETYFVEMLSQPGAKIVNTDQQQALLTLVRSYLSGLIHLMPGPDCTGSSSEEDFFGNRHNYLDLLPPFTPESSSHSEQSPQNHSNLLKLQSLLCAPICDETCRETVLIYLQEHKGISGAFSLEICCRPFCEDSVDLLVEEAPSALPSYCHEAGQKSPVWARAVMGLTAGTNTPRKEQALDAILEEMATTWSVNQLLEILPPGEQYKHYMASARKLSQAAKMQYLIVNTGQKLLSSLTISQN